MIKLSTKRSVFKIVVLLGAMVLFTQCRTITLSDLREFHSPDKLMLDVEFESFPEMECGPYVTYSILKYYLPHEDIDPENYKEIDLTWAFSIVEYLRRKGLEAELKTGNLTLLREHLVNQDIPIVFIRRSRFRRYGHYVLFTGYDFDKGHIWLFDERKQFRMPLFTFLRAWERGNKYFISVSLPE